MGVNGQNQSLSIITFNLSEDTEAVKLLKDKSIETDKPALREVDI
jgi:hypothetical protein